MPVTASDRAGRLPMQGRLILLVALVFLRCAFTLLLFLVLYSDLWTVPDSSCSWPDKLTCICMLSS